MLHPSTFHFRKTKNLTRDYHARKLIGRHRFRDVPHMKLTDIFKSLRHRRLRTDVPQRYSLTHSGSFPPPLANHHSSPVPPPTPDIFTPPYHVRYYSDAVRIPSATESDCLSGMSPSNSGLKGTLSVAERERHFSPCPFPTFATSPSLFQLRSSSTKDYLVDQLEQHLRQLSLGDVSLDHVSNNSSRDIPMDVCLNVSDSPSSRRPLSDRDVRKALPSPQDQNIVPTILITSVNAKHAKPLPPSTQRPSRTPFGPSNVANHSTNVPSTKFKLKTPHDDPFTTQANGSVLPPNYNLTFRLPALSTVHASLSKYAPETPTPMCCNHMGDCRGDLWEVLHPPLVPGRFTLPPFRLPPLSTGLFGDVSTSLP